MSALTYKTVLSDAHRLATKAKPGMLKINNKTYTFIFDPERWVYSVYEDMTFMCDYNTKQLATAKKWLRDYLSN